MTDWNNDEAREHLALRLRAAGVEDMLAREGAVRGDEVDIAGRVFEYIPEGSDETEESDRETSSP
jgi:GTP-binding protein